MGIKKTAKEFVEEARIVHGDKYDYSKVEYISSKTKVCIICLEHGEFWQIPYSHLKGRGCPVCRYIKSSSKVRMTQNEFIERATEIHKGKYDYSKVEYKNTDTKVTIICPIHGEFKQTPHHHLKGIGCAICGSKTYDTKEFIRRARLKHGNKYDYSKTQYKGKKHRVVIICPIHGEFEQLPQNHLRRSGCPECGLRFDVQEKKVLKLLEENYTNVIYQYRNNTFLKGKGNNMSIDCFLPDYNIGVEYQGTQHFYPLEYFGGEKTFKIVTDRDKRKFEKCTENGLKLFYVSFERKIPNDYFQPICKTPEELINAINDYIKEIETKNVKKINN